MTASNLKAQTAWNNAEKKHPANLDEVTKTILSRTKYAFKSPFFFYDIRNGNAYPFPVDNEVFTESVNHPSFAYAPKFRNSRKKACIDVFPTIISMQTLPPAELKSVNHFKVIHKRYGSVVFKEPIDVSGLVIDDVFLFGDNEIDIKSEGSPLSGKTVEVTIRNTFPYSITPEGFTEYEKELRQHSASIGAKFIAYERGSYIFQIKLN